MVRLSILELRHARAGVRAVQPLAVGAGMVASIDTERDRRRAVGRVLKHVERWQPFRMTANPCEPCLDTRARRDQTGALWPPPDAGLLLGSKLFIEN